MKITRTIKLPLDAKPEDFLPVTEAFTKAFNFVCERGWKDSDTNGISLHQKTYQDCKAKFNLPAQLACAARVKATEALLSVKERIKKGKKATCPKSKQCPIRLDARTYTIWFSKNICSIITLDKRKKCSFKVPQFYKQFINWKQASADLVIKNNKVFLHLVMQKDIEDPIPTGKVVGIDVGIKRAAVTNLNQFFGGGRLSHIANEYKRRRKALQKKRHAGKRHLVKLGRKENRFVNDMLHCISKKIVSLLERGDIVVMEKLTGIRDNNRRSKKLRTALNAWVFNKLQFMTQYKAEAKGCLVLYINPAKTSQECNHCHHTEKANRINQSLFKCKECNHKINADLNSSRNIADRGKMQLATRQLHGLSSISLDAPCCLS